MPNNGYPNGIRAQCIGMLKSGRRCNAFPLQGSEYCYNCAPGKVKVQLTHQSGVAAKGVYAPYLPPHLQATYDLVCSPEGKINISDDLELSVTRTLELLQSMEGPPILELTNEVLGRVIAALNSLDRGRPSEAIEELSALRDKLMTFDSREKTWEKIDKNIEQRRKLYETEWRTQKSMTVEQLVVILVFLRTQFAGILERYVDERIKRSILEELSSGVSGLVPGRSS